MSSGGVMTMNINSFKYCVRQSSVSLKRNFWLAIVTACIIAVSLAILGGFLLMAVNVGQFVTDVEANVEIGVFLHTDANVEKVGEQLSALEGVDSITFVSRDEGLDTLAESLGDPALL